MNRKKIFGLIGKNLDHSLSPLIFNNYFRRMNLNYCYELFPLEPESLPEFLKKLRSSSIRGVNVTIPYKERIMTQLDEIEREAEIIGSVNVICHDRYKLKGYNTDCRGFIRSLKPILPGGRERAVVLGAGGGSRSVIYALYRLGIKKILFFSCSRKRIKKVMDDFSFIPGLEGHLWDEQRIKLKCQKAELIINATPVGMFPEDDCSPLVFDFPLRKKLLVYDLIYNPAETKFMREARRRGAAAENGIKMLFFQALESYKIWNKERVNEAVFLKTLEEVAYASLSDSR